MVGTSDAGASYNSPTRTSSKMSAVNSYQTMITQPEHVYVDNLHITIF